MPRTVVCPVCRGELVSVNVIYLSTGSGKVTIVAERDELHIRCRACRCRGVVKDPRLARRLMLREYSRIVATLGLSVPEVAKVLGVRNREVSRALAGTGRTSQQQLAKLWHLIGGNCGRVDSGGA